MEITFEDTDFVIRGKSVLRDNGISFSDGVNYRCVVVDFDDKNKLRKMMKQNKVKCEIKNAVV